MLLRLPRDSFRACPPKLLFGSFKKERRRVGYRTGHKISQTNKFLFNDFGLIFTFLFGEIVGPNGKDTILDEIDYNAWVAQRRPRPPAIQTDLLKAHAVKDRLSNTPGLNQTALARELGIDRTSLIRTLNLTRLAPAIQDYINQLEPDTRRCPLTKKHLRFVATIADPEAQKEQFKKLIDSLQATEWKYEKLSSCEFPEL